MSSAAATGDQSMFQPGLYEVNDHGDTALKGMRCSCGRVAFPFHAFGCEACGRTGVQAPADLAARGTIVAALLVHLHPASHPKAPFAIGAIRLDSGPIVRAMLAADVLDPGTRVAATFVEAIAESGQPTLDLRFGAVNDEDRP